MIAVPPGAVRRHGGSAFGATKDPRYLALHYSTGHIPLGVVFVFWVPGSLRRYLLVRQ